MVDIDDRPHGYLFSCRKFQSFRHSYTRRGDDELLDGRHALLAPAYDDYSQPLVIFISPSCFILLGADFRFVPGYNG